MRHADELHERIRRRDGVRERRPVEWVARDHLATRMDSRTRARPCEGADAMPASQEQWNQVTAEVTRSSGDEDNPRCHWPTLRLSDKLGLPAGEGPARRSSSGSHCSFAAMIQ